MKKIVKISQIVVLNLFLVLSYDIYAQTLDQQLRQAQQEGVISSTNISNTVAPNLSQLNQTNSFFSESPLGILSLIETPSAVEEIQTGFVTMYFPKGYGNSNLHYGIWNAIPFIVFDNNTLELRLGLIFEHRQVGFVPDEWINSVITGKGMPEISFLIPKTKIFLNFVQGASQWRSTVLLTDDQIKNLKAYSGDVPESPDDPYANIFTVTHRLLDGTSTPYLIGVRNRSYFKIMIQLYDYIAKNPLVKKFKGSDAFPAGAFFDGVVATPPQTQSQVQFPSPSTPKDTSGTNSAVEKQPKEDIVEEDIVEEDIVEEDIVEEDGTEEYIVEEDFTEEYIEEEYEEYLE